MEKKSMLELDPKNLFSDSIGEEQGISPSNFDRLSEGVIDYTKDIRLRRGKDIGFMELPYDVSLREDIKAKAQELRQWCSNFVVLGIGGSALGGLTIQNALHNSFYNQMCSPKGSENSPGIFILDNVDPVFIKDFLEFIGPELPSTAFNVITKSGSTAETMSQFLHIRELLAGKKGCDPRKQIILTTDPDPDKSLLARIGKQHGYCCFPVPANVGGRFSVLSAVGLLSAAVSGIDTESLLKGAAAMEKKCCNTDLYGNPAALYACGLYEHYKKGKPISVIMPYSQRLKSFALWYCQLWAESLGKRDGLSQKKLFTGPTPVASVGVTDQHSVMQLYQDGPFDKVITFIETDQCRAEEVKICEGDVEPELKYLSGKSFNSLFQAELAATRCALRDKQRPNCTIKIPEVSAATLGELFMFFEYAVTYSGYLYDVNAFDQPGVELGKEYTYGLMGREGYKPPANL